MIPIHDLTSFLNGSSRGKRHLLLFHFVCDESYDSPNKKLPKGSPRYEPKTYVVAGFFSNHRTWNRVVKLWESKNKRIGVPRFHASHLNARTWEFEGWSRNRQIRYSRDIVRIVKDQKAKMHAVSCGLLADDYRRIINEEGRVKFGHPYIVCFKTCLSIIAKEMDHFPPEDQFDVYLDRNDMELEAVRVFYEMKDDPGFRYRSRLAGCTPMATDQFVALEVADLIAYETFRLLHEKRYRGAKVRHVLQSMFDRNGFSGYYFSEETLKYIKEPLEASACRPDGFVFLNSDRQKSAGA